MHVTEHRHLDKCAVPADARAALCCCAGSYGAGVSPAPPAGPTPRQGPGARGPGGPQPAHSTPALLQRAGAASQGPSSGLGQGPTPGQAALGQWPAQRQGGVSGWGADAPARPPAAGIPPPRGHHPQPEGPRPVAVGNAGGAPTAGMQRLGLSNGLGAAAQARSP